MAQKEIKCLAVGDVNGQFGMLVKRIAAINSKNGPFELLFCLGEFFGPNDEENKKLLDGDYELPVPAYILGPCCPSTAAYYPEDGAQLTPSITYLGRKGIFYTAEGLNIGYCSGIDGQTSNAFQFVEDDIDDLLLPIRTQSGFLGVDVLLTSIWPADVSKHSINQPSVESPGSKSIARLAAGLKPRYHFAGKSGHFERSPYRNHRVLLEAAQHVTRFIGLAAVGNKAKEKWIYAFSIKPMRKLDRAELTKQPGNSTEFPYMDVLQEYVQLQMQKQQAEQQQGSQFFFDPTHYSDEENGEQEGGGRRGRRRGGDHGGPPAKKKFEQMPADNCWFCLANNTAERHLVVAVGSSVYMALPKGGLSDEHVLLLSVNHVQSLVTASAQVREEVVKYKDAFTLLCANQNMAVVCWERNYKTSHLTFEMIGCPQEKTGALRAAFLQTGDKYGLEFTFVKEEENVWDLVNEGNAYFYCECNARRLPPVHPLDGRLSVALRSRSEFFPLDQWTDCLQVISGEQILNCPDKSNWRSCVLSKEDETKVATSLKQRFKPFDFNADSDSDDD
ncbi:CWF19-like protein 1-like protein [Aphelenchoides fujianensis]|nr:CWF19-like protein 1-like protein [Aphelenchoides fujianensis]